MQDIVGEAGTMYSYRPPHIAEKKQDGLLQHRYSSSVRIRDVTLKTCQKRWTIGRCGERESGVSVLAAREEEDDDNDDIILLVWWLECTPMTRETGVQSHVESYQILKKWGLMSPCLTLSIIRYGSRMKGSNPVKEVAPSPTFRCSCLWKKSPQIALDYIRLTYLYYINLIKKFAVVLKFAYIKLTNHELICLVKAKIKHILWS